MPHDKATYAQHKAAGRCVRCARPRGRSVLCDECATQQNRHKRAYRARHRAALLAAARQAREAQWAAPGSNLIACCGGTLHPILVLPGKPQILVAACCRRVLGVLPAAQEEAPCAALS
jgi:hypothetical protein